MSKTNQYFGKLNSEEIANGINLAIKNAKRLYKDAEILFNESRFSSSLALAILAIEESGKVSILRGLSLEEDNKKRSKWWKEYRNHLKKNSHWILPQLVSEGARVFDELSQMYSEDADHPQFLDTLKQLALYTDCLGKRNWTYPEEIVDKDLCESILKIAEVFTSKDEVTKLEIDLWKKHLKPVWLSDTQTMKKALLAWHEDMKKHNLNSEDDRFIEFLMNKAN